MKTRKIPLGWAVAGFVVTVIVGLILWDAFATNVLGAGSQSVGRTGAIRLVSTHTHFNGPTGHGDPTLYRPGCDPVGGGRSPSDRLRWKPCWTPYHWNRSFNRRHEGVAQTRFGIKMQHRVGRAMKRQHHYSGYKWWKHPLNTGYCFLGTGGLNPASCTAHTRNPYIDRNRVFYSRAGKVYVRCSGNAVVAGGAARYWGAKVGSISAAEAKRAGWAVVGGSATECIFHHMKALISKEVRLSLNGHGHGARGRSW